VEKLKQLDLVFCVDLTGSMAHFIATAKQQMAKVLAALRDALGDGLRVAIVGYRDHCDGKKLLEVHELDRDLARVATMVARLEVSGGGDAPEAVYTGLAACLELAWIKGSYRVVILVGDAPPHGVGAAGDQHAKGDPTGYSLDDMANRLEAEGVFVHALAMQPNDPILATSFQRLSISTGGGYHDATSANAAIAVVQSVTASLLDDLALDARVLARLVEGIPLPPVREDEVPPSRAQILAGAFRVEPLAIHQSFMRLRRRRLLDGLDV
jgi:Mg-chelatase subunit ChlD